MARMMEAWSRVNDTSLAGINGYMMASMSFGRSCVWMNLVSGSRIEIEFALRTW